MIKEKLPSELKIKRFKDPVDKRWSYTLLGRKRGQKTWSTYFKEVEKSFLTEDLKYYSINIKNVPLESYIWGKGKNKFGWIKQK